MSFIKILGYGCPWTVPAEETFRILRAVKGKTVVEQDLSALELLRKWAHKVHDPHLPAGLPVNDPHWISWSKREIQTIDNMIESCKKHVLREEGMKGRLVVGG